MTNHQLLSAIGEIDDRFILSAVSPSPKRIWIRVCAIAACICLILTGIHFFQRPDPHSPPIVIHGGDNHNYYYAYDAKLYSLSGELQDWLTQQKYNINKWLNQRDQEGKNSPYNVADPKFRPLLLEAIEKFNIPRSVIEKFNPENTEYHFTKEELDAIFTQNQAQIAHCFASPYAILVKDQAFAPRFYLHASEDEQKRYGITQEMVDHKIGLLHKENVIQRADPFTSYCDTDYGLPFSRKAYELSVFLSPYDSGTYEWAEQKILEIMDERTLLSTSETPPLILQIIRQFNIEKTVFEQMNNERIAHYQKTNEPYFITHSCFTQEEIDILYSGNNEAIVQTFASPYSIKINGKAYAPAFYLNATKKERAEIGITDEMIEQKRALLYRYGVLGF